MRHEKAVTMEDGAERRTLAFGENEDGTIYVSEASEGDLNEFAFGAAERVTTLRFRPTEDYGLADVENRIETSDDDCFVSDFEDALALWGVSYTREKTLRPLVA